MYEDTVVAGTRAVDSSFPTATQPPTTSESAFQEIRLPDPSPSPSKPNWDISQLCLPQGYFADAGESIPVAGVRSGINQRLSWGETPMRDTELDSLHKVVCEGIDQLQRMSEIGTGGQARILYRELAQELEQRGTLDELKVLATHIEKQSGKRFNSYGQGRTVSMLLWHVSSVALSMNKRGTRNSTISGTSTKRIAAWNPLPKSFMVSQNRLTRPSARYMTCGGQAWPMSTVVLKGRLSQPWRYTSLPCRGK
jgi:hypothetical protein